MKIESPEDNVLIGGKTISDLLEELKLHRKGNFNEFFNTPERWRSFINDNNRLKNSFENKEVYVASNISYKTIKNTLIGLYQKGRKASGCEFISDLREAHLYKTCPYCGQGVCTTLDHYYDKDNYSELSLNVWNLVPSCGDCNFKKLNDKIRSATERYLHPYFDHFFSSGDSYDMYFIRIELINDLCDYTLSIKGNDRLSVDVQNLVNWHIREMGTQVRNGKIIRSNFEYYIKRVRSSVNIKSKMEVREVLKDESSYELDFTWRGVVVKSLICDSVNFDNFFKILNSR